MAYDSFQPIGKNMKSFKIVDPWCAIFISLILKLSTENLFGRYLTATRIALTFQVIVHLMKEVFSITLSQAWKRYMLCPMGKLAPSDTYIEDTLQRWESYLAGVWEI